jgi:hypothetical protein
MIGIDWRPDREKLRQFGWVSLGGFCVLGLIVAWRTGTFSETGTWTLPLCLWGLALVTWLTGLLAPQLLRPLYLLLTAIALPIGLVVSTLALALIFTFFIIPPALWFRLTGRDALQRAWNAPDNSFWLKSAPPRDSASYYRPF